MKPNDRIIVALDVPTNDEALELVHELGDLVSFYKVGLELLMAGGMEGLLKKLLPDKKVFVDLKLPNDIPATVRSTVGVAAKLGVTFLTLSHSATRSTIAAAIEGRGARTLPDLLFVPALSSVDEKDFAQTGHDESEFRADLLRRAKDAKSASVNGFIVSGQEIGLLRQEFPGVTLVSPGIRPAGASQDDHKRSCTPAEAIRLGADYIVVGRPIRNAKDRRGATQRIIDEIAGGRVERTT
jgi:orotidine-5'-phosphate decarboxylase